MKNKKIIMYVGIILFVLIIIGVGYILYEKIKNKTEGEILDYIPQAEITEEQLRQTVITLYFLDPNTYEIAPEARKVDAKELIDNPYKFIVSLLIQGPKNEKLVKLIPEETKINIAEIRNNILYLDFSEEFIKEQNLGKEQEELIVKSIVNTLTELTEINQIKILINGEENHKFPDNGISFDKIFIRQ